MREGAINQGGGNRWIGHAWLMAGMMLLSAGGWVWMSRNGVDPTGKPLGTDFLSFWSASSLALQGHAAAAWDVAAHHRVQAATFGFDPGYAAFFYPPPFLLLCWPLALAPYGLALALWVAGGFMLWWLAARQHWQGIPPVALLLVAFPASLINAGHGQNGFFTAAIIGAGLPLMTRRPALAGAVLGCLIIKPHLALLLPLALALRGEWRTFAATAASALSLCALSWIAFGTEAWVGFLNDSALARRTLEEGLVDYEKMQSAYAAIRLWGGGSTVAWGIQGLFSLLAVVALVLVRGTSRSAQDSVFAVAAILATPFVFDYDLTWLAWPLLWLARRTQLSRAEKILMAAAFLMPLLSRSLALGTGIAVGPLILVALLGILVRRARAESLASATATG